MRLFIIACIMILTAQNNAMAKEIVGSAAEKIIVNGKIIQSDQKTQWNRYVIIFDSKVYICGVKGREDAVLEFRCHDGDE